MKLLYSIPQICFPYYICDISQLMKTWIQRLKPLETATKKFISLQRMLHMACNITRKKIQFAIIFKYERIIQVFLRGMHVFFGST